MSRAGAESGSGDRADAGGVGSGPPRKARRQGVHDCTHCGRPIAGTSADPVVALKDGWFHYRCMGAENRGKFAREARAARAAEGEIDAEDGVEKTEGAEQTGDAAEIAPAPRKVSAPPPKASVPKAAPPPKVAPPPKAAEPKIGVYKEPRNPPKKARKLTPEEIRAAQEEEEEEDVPCAPSGDAAEVLKRAIEATTPRPAPTGAFGGLLASMHDFEEVDPASVEVEEDDS